MVSQLLFGEIYSVIEEQNDWILIQSSYDEYRAWISKLMFTLLEPDFLDFIIENKNYIISSLSIISLIGDNYPQYIPAGSSLPGFSKSSKSFQINERTYKFYSSENEKLAEFNHNDILDIAYRYMNAPYLWGGRTIFGIDCSGFTQIVYKICGIKILRDAYQQFSQGYFISNFSEIKSGDLAFFGQSISKITHVGILINQNSIIHASGSVRIDKWDEIGIFNAELNKYTHKLVGIKRIE
jgi:hypothetical protein